MARMITGSCLPVLSCNAADNSDPSIVEPMQVGGTGRGVSARTPDFQSPSSQGSFWLQLGGNPNVSPRDTKQEYDCTEKRMSGLFSKSFRAAHARQWILAVGFVYIHVLAPQPLKRKRGRDGKN